MAARFEGSIGAFAYLLAVLLYMPCLAAMAAIQREAGTSWAIFASAWTTGLGYGAAVVAYQAGTFSRHPDQSAAWIIGVLATAGLVIAVLRWLGTRHPQSPLVGAAGE
jgi:ferrous iron transport protein B